MFHSPDIIFHIELKHILLLSCFFVNVAWLIKMDFENVHNCSIPYTDAADDL